MVATAVAAAHLLGGASAALAQSGLPDLARTPSALNPDVTQDNIHETICAPGWTRTVRPPRRYTTELKRRQLQDWGYADRNLGDYEEDHLVPLALGGAPYDPRNLWPEPWEEPNGWGAWRKDEVEIELNRRVCDGRMSLAEAQAAITSDWIAAWRRYVHKASEGGEAANGD